MRNRGTGEPEGTKPEGTLESLSFLRDNTDNRKAGNRKNNIRADDDFWIMLCLKMDFPSSEGSATAQEKAISVVSKSLEDKILLSFIAV
ncbi:hypothetical protein OQX61_06145 [Pedobacter sp. PLR]|uniref:hypothetical protein n=1 Tax=Pedobacter sp. PLR TaxID=2994465 RepID=UPI00224547CF|nr:hypothetical protein [Pedobacter sp. PLR]MCX2450851.1 hypothetical protein [Pedobacter sp. PLR]